MRWSQLHIPTLREDPADADAASHRLLVRGGFIRQLMAGHYSLLPLGIRVRAKIIDIIRDEMNAIGAQEFLVPDMHPAQIWEKSGRLAVMRRVRDLDAWHLFLRVLLLVCEVNHLRHRPLRVNCRL